MPIGIIDFFYAAVVIIVSTASCVYAYRYDVVIVIISIDIGLLLMLWSFKGLQAQIAVGFHTFFNIFTLYHSS